VLEKLAGKVDSFVKDHYMSAHAFFASLDQYAEVAISINTPALLPVLVTTAIADGKHDELLNFDKSIHKYASVLQPAKAIPTSVVFHLAEIVNEGWSAMHLPRVPVAGIFESNRLAGEDPNYVFQINNVAFNFYESLKGHGTCILGSMLKSEHFGLSRAVVELARTMEMNIDAGKQAAGGVFMQLGMVLDVVRKDGGKEKITITSVK
jgi:hypothetical protein